MRSITSVTRWLLVVVGCAILAMAQPMSAASPEEATPSSGPAADRIIYPQNSPERPREISGKNSGSSLSFWPLAAALLLATGGVWVLVQRRHGSGLLGARGQRRLQIDETRPLGNRQYLVVASYDHRKFLIGVAPGQINLLTPLDTPSAPEKSP